MNFRNDTTGEVGPGHCVGTDDRRRRLWSHADGWLPVGSHERGEDGRVVELIRQGWAAPGSMYDVAVRYGRDCSDIEALERRSGRRVTVSGARDLERAIRERLDRDRPVRASRAL